MHSAPWSPLRVEGHPRLEHDWADIIDQCRTNGEETASDWSCGYFDPTTNIVKAEME